MRVVAPIVILGLNPPWGSRRNIDTISARMIVITVVLVRLTDS